MHKLIVTSATYRQVSLKDARDAAWPVRLQKDPGKDLWSRQIRRRLTGEMLRDTMLAVSSSLSKRKGGPGVRPPLPTEITSTLLRNQWPVSKDEADHRRRSIYLFARRNLRYPLFELFDRPALAETCARRKISTTAPQSLALLNSEFARNAAQRLSVHLTGNARSPRDRAGLCYQLTLVRAPKPVELAAALELMAGAQNSRQGLADLSLAIFNLNEFLYID